MTEITNPTLVTDVEKNPTVEEQERMVVGGFVTACSNGNLKTVIDQLKNKKIRDIMVSKENNFYITEALNVACKKNQEKFIEDFIFKREIMGLLGNINRSEIFKQACENGHTELVKLFMNKESILDELNIDSLCHAFCFSIYNGYLDVIEELFNNKKMVFKIYNDKSCDPSSEFIAAAIHSENIKPEIRRKIIMLILNDYEKKQLINKDVLSRLLINSYLFGEEEIFDRLLTDDKLKNKIVADSALRVLKDSFINNKISFFKKIIDNDLLRPKLIKDHKDSMISIFVSACKNNKREIIDILKTNEEIKDKILPNTFYKICETGNTKAFETLISIDGMLDKIKSKGYNIIQECFQIACINEKTDIINRLLNNQNIKNEIRPGIIESCFNKACDNGKASVINTLINNRNVSINFTLKEQAIRKCFTKACNSGETSIALELIENPDTKGIILGKGSNITLNNFFNSLSQKKSKLDESDLRLALLVVRTKKNETIETNVYETNIKNIIENLINNLKINKNNFKSIKSKEGCKEFIEEKKRESSREENWDECKEKWNDNTPLQKTLLSLEKINKELLINKQKGIN